MSTRDDDSFDLSRPTFKRGQLAAAECQVIEFEFASCVQAVLGKIDDGKEATVYLCRTRADACDRPFLAAKMYRARIFRAFANDSAYRNPGRMRDRRLAKAMRQRSRKGVHAAHLQWVDREWEALSALYAAGASVPQPYLRCSNGILMEYLGDADGSAPSLATPTWGRTCCSPSWLTWWRTSRSCSVAGSCMGTCPPTTSSTTTDGPA